MYGTRPAAQDWQRTVCDLLTRAGFTPGRAGPNTYWHSARGILTFVHGDDFASTGEPKDLRWLQDVMEKELLVKTQVLGPDVGQVRQVRMLNRLLTWVAGKGIYIEADTRHVDRIIEALQVKDLKSLKTPGVKVYGRPEGDEKKGGANEHPNMTDSDETKARDIARKRKQDFLEN